MLYASGVPEERDLQRVMPSAERRAKGPVVWMECFEEIPCNPCQPACPTGAILPFDDINDLPHVEDARCTGCALCVAACPGLAIFVIDETHSDTHALLKLPYELRPLPEKGEVVEVLDRTGEVLGTSPVLRVQNPSSFDRTAVITIEIMHSWVDRARGIRRQRVEAEGEKDES